MINLADDTDDVLDVPGAARLLHLGVNTIYDHCNRGLLPHRRIGNRIRFSRVALLRWLAGDTVAACGPGGASERQ